jgi:uncharacterized RDD family membrane protein YckC
MLTCKACSSPAIPGLRWCGICHTNIQDPSAGRLASPARRLAAYIVDCLIPSVAILTMLGVVGAGGLAGGDTGLGLGVLGSLGLLCVYIAWALWLFVHGSTPGKRLLGMRVVKEDGRPAGLGTMIVREWFGKAFSGLVLALGYFAILWNRDRQGWHDRLASTYVVQ